MPKLILLSGDQAGREFSFSRDILIGRDPHCGIVLADPSVSREHARILFRDGDLVLKDLGSRNGCFLDGSKIEEAPLRPGQEIVLGKLLLRFVEEVPVSGPEEILLEEEAPPTAPPPTKPAPIPARPAPRKLRELPIEPSISPKAARQAFLHQDFLQYGGAYRFLILLGILGLCAGLFFGARYLSARLAASSNSSAEESQR